MNTLASLYGHSLALLTDLYQLTMAYGYWKSGLADSEAAFHLFYRHNPFQGGYCVAAGLGLAMDFIEGFRFTAEDTAYLAGLAGADGRPLFDEAFLAHLRELAFSCDVDAVPEGTVVFPHEPLVRVCGPIVQAQLLETPLLNLINFQTLVATKAARICAAAQGDPVVEFGLRRAQGIDGGTAASRAAFIGGCAATSNLLAGKLYGIPVRGTHAHSWVMAFDDELSAFQAYAAAMPNNCVFLVDTYDTLQGVRRAVEVGRWLRQQGHEMVGIRLDSGDLAYLSIEARKLLDEGGFPHAAIVGSNELDEYVIASLKQQGAPIGVWGVGTRLATAYDQPALGGVYKLSAVRSAGQPWQHRLKLSEQAIKVSNPGILQVRRFHAGGQCVGDMLFDEELGISENTLFDPQDPNRFKRLPAGAEHRDLLVPIFRHGRSVYPVPPLETIRGRAAAELAQFSPAIRRFLHPHEYPVGLEPQLHRRKMHLVRRARGLE